MRYLTIGQDKFSIPQLALGCMRINGLSLGDARAMVDTAMDLGINFFDHANIYGHGECESHFAKAIGMNPTLREQMILQTKCAIRYGIGYDCSYEHIMTSVHESLRRLQTEYIDILLIHRPDALMEAEEVAKAFSELKADGKVRRFGVSNFNSYQIELLQSCCDMPLEFNQLQLSLTTSFIIDEGLNVNTFRDGAIVRDGSVLDYCQLKKITVQAWSPYHHHADPDVIIDNPRFERMNQCLAELSLQYGVSKQALLTAWINRHPAKMQTLIGTMNQERLKDICTSTNIDITREDWYKMYVSTGKFVSAVSNYNPPV